MSIWLKRGLGIALLTLGLAGPAQAADVKIGFVNAAELLEKAPQAEAARKSHRDQFAPREKLLLSQAKDIKRLEEKLSRDSAVMSDDGRRKLEREILDKRRDYKRDQENFAEDASRLRNELLQDLQEVVMKSVVHVAKEGKFDMVLSEGVVFVSDRVDMTPDVLDHLRNAGK